MKRALLVLWCMASHAATPAPPCQTSPPLSLRVQFQGDRPRDALLLSRGTTGLQLIDASSRSQLWSEGPATSDTQHLLDLAGLGTNLIALDTDADGLQDRIYTGDRYGRLWRLDLHAGFSPSMWMQATLLADLSVPGGGRGFVATPDVTRVSSGSGSSSWLQLAIGTANTGAPRNDHRFYILRDTLTGALPAPVTEAALVPLTPADLASVASGTILRGNAPGFYLPLGSAQVQTAALTLDGMTWFTAIEQWQTMVNACPPDQLPMVPATLSISAVRTSEATNVSTPSNGGPPAPQAGFLRRSTAGSMSTTDGVMLETSIDAAGRSTCVVSTQPVPECFLDTRPRRTWWRREDAD